MTPLYRRIEDVIARIVPIVREVATVRGYDDVDPRPHPPASQASIQAFERFLERRLPASYRAFLELHDGYDWLAYPGHMLSIADAMPGSRKYEQVLEWKRMIIRYGGGDVADGIVFGSLDEPHEWVFLDPNRPSGQNELTVVALYHDDAHEFRDVVEFLESRIDYCREILSPDNGSPSHGDSDD